MTTYLDASLVVSLIASEADSPRVEAWVLAQTRGDLAISAWVAAEVASALSNKVRAHALTPAQRASVATEWGRVRQGFVNLPIEPATFATAELWVERHELNLRAADALHLAVAAAHGCTLATLDRRVAEAATILGVPVAVI